MSLLHSDYHSQLLQKRQNLMLLLIKIKLMKLMNWMYSWAYIYFVALLLEEIQIAIPYRQHLNFEAAVSLVCSSLQISVLRIGAVIFYSFFVQHMRRARNWWWDSLVCFVNSSRVEDTSRLWCKKEDKQLYILVVNWISNWLTFYYAIGS